MSTAKCQSTRTHTIHSTCCYPQNTFCNIILCVLVGGGSEEEWWACAIRDSRGTVFCCTQNTFCYITHSVELCVLVGGGAGGMTACMQRLPLRGLKTFAKRPCARRWRSGRVDCFHYILSLVYYILLYTEHILLCYTFC
jgi:hypothetical protein